MLFSVRIGDEVLKSVDAANRNDQIQHHGKSGIDGAGDEVRRENGRMPSGQLRHGEIKAHHAMNREHQWRRQTAEQADKPIDGAANALPNRASPARPMP